MAVRLWTFNHWIRFSYRLLLMVLSSAAAVVCIICDFWVNIMYDWSGKMCRFDMIFIYYHSMQCKLTVPTTLLFFRDCLGTTASSTWDIFTFFIRNSYSDRVHIFLGTTALSTWYMFAFSVWLLWWWCWCSLWGWWWQCWYLSNLNGIERSNGWVSSWVSSSPWTVVGLFHLLLMINMMKTMMINFIKNNDNCYDQNYDNDFIPFCPF